MFIFVRRQGLIEVHLSQVATADRMGRAACHAFDLVSTPVADEAEVLGALRRVLQDPGVRKVVHDGRRSGEALFYQFDISLANVMDTQVTRSSPDDSDSRSPVTVILLQHAGCPGCCAVAAVTRRH